MSITKKPKILIFDIETTNLTAAYGFMLCIGWKWLGEAAVHVKSVMDFPVHFKRDCTDDRPLIQFATDLLRSADMLFGWYSTRFDQPFINTRAIKHGIDVVPRDIPHVDGWKVARYGMAFRSNGLKGVSEFLGLSHKTRLDCDSWIRAAAGDRKAISYVIDHCRADIVDTTVAYQRLRPLMTQHPNIALIANKPDACPRCGKTGTLTKAGVKIAQTRSSQRYQCQDCGSWCLGETIKSRVTVR